MKRIEEEIKEIKDFFSKYDWGWISRDERQWWPNFCFHYTDLHNVPLILSAGYLYSRRYLETHKTHWQDVASHQVLGVTDEETKKSVRFYFRPKTPTQYHIEGIKSKDSLRQAQFQAHCQMPVFLLFDIVDTLSRKDSQFSDGNLGNSQSNKFHKPQDLWDLPWQKIYHKGSFDPLTQGEITRHRCAEIIIPEKIDLYGLKYIYCRSEAEKETLQYMLQRYPKILSKHQKHITSSLKYDLFLRQHTFIEKAKLLQNKIILYFSPETHSPGPFELKFSFSNPGITARRTFTQTIDDVRLGMSIPVPTAFKDGYIFQLYLDNYLVYHNAFFTLLSDLENIIF
jgi:hypothetical protein